MSLGVKEISGAERQILSVRFPFHRVRVAYSEGGELKYKVLKVCGTVRAGGSNRNSGSGASIVQSWATADRWHTRRQVGREGIVIEDLRNVADSAPPAPLCLPPAS